MKKKIFKGKINNPNSKFEKVLIIIPVFNVELTIVSTLLSIINQNYSNYEVIVSENHSTDRTPEIIGQFSKFIRIIKPPVHLVSEDHGNFCLEYARKRQDIKYLSIYHGDDLYSPDIVKFQVEYLNSNLNVPAVFSDGLIIDQNNNVIGWIKNKKINQCSSTYTYEELLYGMISSTVTCLTPTVMLRCSSIQNKLYKFESKIFGKAADYGLWLKLANKYGYLGIIHHAGIRYRRLGNNESTALEKLDTESDLFKTISIYIGNDKAAQIKGWQWRAHIDRLKVQDYFRRLSSLIMRQNEKQDNINIELPKVRLGYYIISLCSLSGIYYLCILLVYYIIEGKLFSVRLRNKILIFILSSTMRNKIRNVRYKIMEVIKK
jgi:glycosyltransferase involved in cell wall biosynthesis